jgi:hypothetical protein
MPRPSCSSRCDENIKWRANWNGQNIDAFSSDFTFNDAISCGAFFSLSTPGVPATRSGNDSAPRGAEFDRGSNVSGPLTPDNVIFPAVRNGIRHSMLNLVWRSSSPRPFRRSPVAARGFASSDHRLRQIELPSVSALATYRSLRKTERASWGRSLFRKAGYKATCGRHGGTGLLEGDADRYSGAI